MKLNIWIEGDVLSSLKDSSGAFLATSMDRARAILGTVSAWLPVEHDGMNMALAWPDIVTEHIFQATVSWTLGPQMSIVECVLSKMHLCDVSLRTSF